MNALRIAFLLITLVAPAFAVERVTLFARLTEGMPVELTDGSRWNMDKGDCFPVVAYKESHTKIILQLASTSFMVPAAKTQIVPDKEMPAAMASYRTNVNTYISSYAARWRAAAEAAREK